MQGFGLAGGCPKWPNSRPTAVVNVEKPYLITIGFLAIVAGFLLQFLSVPSAKTISQIRAELKAAKLEEKLSRARAVPTQK